VPSNRRPRAASGPAAASRTRPAAEPGADGGTAARDAAEPDPVAPDADVASDHPQQRDPEDLDAPAAVEPSELTNADLARIFHDIGDMLEVKGELVFKTVAYHRAADAIGRSPVDVVAAYRAGTPPRIPGVGQAISDKIAELVTTGRMGFYDRLRAEVPPTLVALLRIPGLGPRTVRLVHEELGVETIEDLREAAAAGRLRGLRGVSARTEAAILDGIAKLETRTNRLLLHEAEAIVEGLVAALSGAPGVRRVVPAGSFRRRRESIGDLDLLAETDDPAGLVERFVGLGVVDEVLNRGNHKAAE
jgi:DNA polymerase (family 10)